MILVAFVLVLVATVTLIIGTFFDAGVAYIWISIAACVATFVVLGISYLARRRSADEPAARPEPLAARDSRTATTRAEPRGSTVGDGAEPSREEAPSSASKDTSVTIVPSRDRTSEPAVEEPAVEEPVADEPAAEEPAAERPGADEPADEPAPRRVAPRRVVRRAPVTAAPTASAADELEEAGSDEAPAAEQPPAAEAPAAEAPEAEAPETETAEAPATPPTGAPIRRVVRRPAGEGGTTRKVVRRAAPGERTVVRRSSAAGTDAAGERRVRRVVRRDEQDGATAAASTRATSPAPAPTPGSGAPKASNGRSGTRGKRARAALSEIKGVGPAKQDALLKRFGSLENMADASIEELSSVKGVGPNVANEIKRALADR